MGERNDGIIELVGENGEKEEFEFIDSVAYNNENYFILAPVLEDMAEDDEGYEIEYESEDETEYDDIEVEVTIMKVIKDKDGNEALEVVEDEEEQSNVFTVFTETWDSDEED